MPVDRRWTSRICKAVARSCRARRRTPAKKAIDGPVELAADALRRERPRLAGQAVTTRARLSVRSRRNGAAAAAVFRKLGLWLAARGCAGCVNIVPLPKRRFVRCVSWWRSRGTSPEAEPAGGSCSSSRMTTRSSALNIVTPRLNRRDCSLSQSHQTGKARHWRSRRRNGPRSSS